MLYEKKRIIISIIILFLSFIINTLLGVALFHEWIVITFKLHVTVLVLSLPTGCILLSYCSAALSQKYRIYNYQNNQIIVFKGISTAYVKLNGELLQKKSLNTHFCPLKFQFYLPNGESCFVQISYWRKTISLAVNGNYLTTEK